VSEPLLEARGVTKSFGVVRAGAFTQSQGRSTGELGQHGQVRR
jgi:hypothetical protein